MKSILRKCSLLMVLFSAPLLAAPFSKWVDQKLPDGRVLKVHYEGDEFHCDFEDEQGRTLVQVGRDFFYAEVDAATGELVATDKKLGDAVAFEPHRRASAAARRRGIERRMELRRESISETTNRWNNLKRITRARREITKAIKEGKKGPFMAPPDSPTLGKVVGCTLLIDFPVVDGNNQVVGSLWNETHPSVTPAGIDWLLNGTGSPAFDNACSVREYFLQQSRERFEYTNIVVGPVTVPYPRSYYDDVSVDAGTNARKLIQDAFTVLTASQDYASISNQLTQLTADGDKFKVLNVFFAGGEGNVWSYGLWAHQWVLGEDQYNLVKVNVNGSVKRFNTYQISPIDRYPTIGTFCHESAHALCGFPDLYPYSGGGRGVGFYSLMSSIRSDSCPGSIDPYLRAAAGWIDPQEVPLGTSTLSCTWDSDSTIWRYTNVQDEKQYYLIEYRYKQGVDALMVPLKGVFIWRCDENGSNMAPELLDDGVRLSNEVSLEQYDGRYDLERGSNYADDGDPWLAGGHGFSSTSSPAAKWNDGTNARIELSNFVDINHGGSFQCVASQAGAESDLIHRWSFNGNTIDSITGVSATLNGSTAWNDANNPTALVLNGNGHDTSYVNLGSGLIPADTEGQLTIELWATVHETRSSARLFEFGADADNCFSMSWSQGMNANHDRVEIKNSGASVLTANDANRAYLSNVPYHIALVFKKGSDNKTQVSWSRRDTVTGELLASGSATTSAAWDVATAAAWANCCLGRSQSAGDSDACATYDEVRIWKTALAPSQLKLNARLGPDVIRNLSLSANTTLTLTSANGRVSVNGAVGVGSGEVAVPRIAESVLEATPNSGYNFVRWTGDTQYITSGEVTSNRVTVCCARDIALTAEYESQATAAYARIVDNQFRYLTANLKPATAPAGGMNNTITILFSTDAEYQQLRAQSTEVAKAAGVQLEKGARLEGSRDWSDIAFSLGGNTIDLAGYGLKTAAMTGGEKAEANENSGFETDVISAGDCKPVTPRGWDIDGNGEIYLVKNNATYGSGVQNGSNWCLVFNGSSITRQIKVDTVGTYRVSFNAASATSSASHLYAQIDASTKLSANSIGTESSQRSFTCVLRPGTYTLRIGCNGGANELKAILLDNVVITRVGGYTSENAGLLNGDFEADYVASGTYRIGAPKNWTMGGNEDPEEMVGIAKNDGNHNYYHQDGSNWCLVYKRCYIEQTFNVAVAGTYRIEYLVAGMGRWNDTHTQILNWYTDYQVLVDGTEIFNQSRISSSGETKSHEVALEAGVHTLRFYCSQSNIMLKYVNIVPPEVAPLEIKVPSGQTYSTSTAAITGGGSMKLVKSGAGTLVMNDAGIDYAGGIAVSEGQVTLGNMTALGAAGEVKIDSGATFELNGVGGLNAFNFVLNGGTLQNTGADVGEGAAQIANIRLTADSTFMPTSSYGLIGNGYGATSLDLGGHTLMVPLGVGKFFYLYNTTVTAGTIDITSGGWLKVDKTAVNAANTYFRCNCALNVQVPFAVGGYEPVFNADYNDGMGVMTVNSVFKPGCGYYRGVTIANGATLDLSQLPGTLATQSTFSAAKTPMVFPSGTAENHATVGLELHGANRTQNALISWNAIPSNLDILPSTATTTDGYKISVQNNGVFAFRSPDAGDLIHRWSFSGNLEDSIGGLTASFVGGQYRWENSSQVRLCGDGNGSGSINLGSGIVPAEAGGSVTFEIWATQLVVKNWSRIFDFGSENQNYLLMSWTQGTDINTDRVEIKNGNTTIMSADHTVKPYSLGVPYHISMTITPAADGKAFLSWAKRDTKTGAVISYGSGTTSAAWDANRIASFSNCFLGRSQYSGDLDASAIYDEVRVWKTALTEGQLSWSARLGPDTLPTTATADTCTLTLTSANGTVSVNGAAGVGSGAVTLNRIENTALVATPVAGYNFVRWTGATDRIIVGDANSAAITVANGPDFALTAEYESQSGSATYARIANNQFQYLNASKRTALEPDGGMNEGITILFSSDEEYQQLKAQSTEVAKAKGVQLEQGVKLMKNVDWSDIPYSLAGQTVDLNGKSLTTSSMTDGVAGYAIPLVNGNFEADSVNSGEYIVTQPKGWEIGGGVRLLKSNLTYGWNNTNNGSTWCVTDVGGYIQQQFTVEQGGDLTVNHTSSSACGWYAAWSSYAVKIDGVVIQSETNIHWQPGGRSVTTSITPGTHTVQFACTGAGGGSVHGIEWDNISLNFTPKGTYTSNSNNLLANGNLQANDVASGARVAMTPDGWTTSGNVWILKNNGDYGDGARDGANWCHTDLNAYIEQQIVIAHPGTYTINYRNAGACGWYASYNSYAVVVDGEKVREEIGVNWGAYDRSCTANLSVGTHTVRFMCSGHTGGSIYGMLWKNISIIGPSVLEVKVPAETTLVNNDVSIKGGGNLAVVKSGAGTFQANKANQGYSGGNRIAEGTLKIANNSAIGGGNTLSVDAGGVFDVNGVGGLNAHTVVLNGGTLQNTGADVADGAAQLTTVRLTADSTIKPTGSYGLIGNDYGATSLDLGGYTLTVQTGEGKNFYLYNTTVTEGTINLEGGTMIADKTALNAASTKFNVNSKLDIRVPFSLLDYVSLYNSDANAGLGVMTVGGTFKPTTEWYRGVTIANGATLDLSQFSGTLGAESSFADDKTPMVYPTGTEETHATVNITVPDNPVQLVDWTAIPSYLDFVCADTGVELESLVNGLFVKQTMDADDLIHRWSFNGNLEDSIGGITATAAGNAVWNAGSNATAIRLYGNGHNTAYVNLGTGLVPSEAGGSATIEIWAKQNSVQNNSRIFDFGADDQNYVEMNWTSGTDVNTDKVEIKDANNSVLAGNNDLKPFTVGQYYHISLVITPADEGKATLTWAKRDVKTGEVIATGSTTTSAAWDANKIAAWGNCFLGCSQYVADADADATYDEVRIWKTALTEEQLNLSARLGPDTLPSSDTPDTVTLTLTSANGTVTVGGAPASGAVTVSRIAEVTLVATPAAGYNFVRWTGATDRIVEGDANSAEITVATGRGDFALTAEYDSQANAVYAKIENNEFKYLTANRKSALEPDGGMNNGITILFSSDEEYQQLKEQSTEVAKAAGVQLDNSVKLENNADWSEIDYSLGGNSVDINGKNLTTKSFTDAGTEGPNLFVNGDFQADYINNGALVPTQPTGWIKSGDVRIFKNNNSVGDSQKNGSNWCFVMRGGYIEQVVNVPKAGNYNVSFNMASRNDSSYSPSDYYVNVDGVTKASASRIGWGTQNGTFTVNLNVGPHTFRFGCNGGNRGDSAINYDNLSLKFCGKGCYTSSYDNRIVNGNFTPDTEGSTAIPKPWTVNSTWSNSFVPYVDAGYCYLGRDYDLRQNFTIVTPGEYTLSMNLYVYTAPWGRYWGNIDGVSYADNTTLDAWTSRTITRKINIGSAGTHSFYFHSEWGQNSGSGIRLDNIRLGRPGMLIIDVPSGTTVANNDISIVGGDNLNVMKTGEGTFQANKSGQSYSGGTVVQGGLLTVGSSTALGGTSEVKIDSGATMDVNGVGGLNAYTFVLNGGMLQNTGADVGDGAAQITTIRLTADSTFKPTGSYGLVGSNYGATTLDLAGHTLTVPIGVGKFFYLYNTTVTAGTLDVTSGGWLVADKTAVNAAEVNLRANCALDIRVPFTLNSYEALFAADYNAGDVPFTLSGTFKPHSSYYHGVVLAKGELIDLSECEGTLNTPGLFTSGANSIIFPGQEVYTPVDWIESSGTQWIHTGIVPNANTVVDLDFSTLGYKNDSTIFGCATWAGNRYLFIEQGDQLRFYGAGTAVTAFAANQRYTFKVTADHKAELYDNAQTLLSSVGIDPTNTDNTQMTLFALNGGGYTGIYRLHAMKIYDGDTLVRDFVPCHDQLGTFGLWDRVEGKFYGNQGTGAFTGPAEAAGEPICVPSKLYVNLHGRSQTGVKIIGWGSAPANVVFEPTAATAGDNIRLVKRPNGLMVPRPTVIILW